MIRSKCAAAALVWAFSVAIAGCSDDGSTPGKSGVSKGGDDSSGSGGSTTQPNGGSGGTNTSAGSGGSSESGGSNTSGGSGGSSGTVNNQGDASAGSAGDSSVKPSDAAPEADADGFVSIFNGQDLTGWVPLIHKSKVGENYMNTFRVDPVNHTLQIKYDQYDSSGFNDRLGLIYYDKFLTNYIVRVTYRFLEPQAPNPVSWGRYNSGLMIFCLDPHKVQGDPEFPPLIELQILGSMSAGGDSNINLCTPTSSGQPSEGVTKVNGHSDSGGCQHSMFGQNSAPPHGDWVTVEAEVHVNSQTKVYQTYPLGSQKMLGLTIDGVTQNGQPATGGYMSLQSESHPCEFKDILLKELPQ